MIKRTLLSATWCGPCQFLKNRLAEQANYLPILDIDSPEGMELVQKYKIRTVPTLLEIDEDNTGPEGASEVHTFHGADDILERLKKDV